MNWQFDHIAFNTPNQVPLHGLFGKLLDLTAGPRPPFRFPGSWLYQDQQAMVHVIERSDIDQPALSHIALRTDADARQVMARVKASGLPHGFSEVPETQNLQIFVQLPAGLLLELLVPASNDPSLREELIESGQLATA